MTAGETELEMADRHEADQEKRTARQGVLIDHLRKVGVPEDDALGLLDSMRHLLETMRGHLARLSN